MSFDTQKKQESLHTASKHMCGYAFEIDIEIL